MIFQWLADAAPDPSSPSSVVDFILRGGATATLIVGTYLWLTGRIVTRRELDTALRQRDEALAIVYQQFGIASRAVDLSSARLENEQQLLEVLQRERGPG